ncbi:ATP-dependent DNA helicase [Methylomagnum ishizawai]|uniref:ATP-dependent DNA helicase n=1 Tax=Methylomagnum ishizawai TaxID=1760988 RepID=UPI001C32CAE8|nr:ATP-dependent DNA helicase [Methylomagnum ishizawai]BBL75227.1 helicase [Methylomagnum ishizawai]
MHDLHTLFGPDGLLMRRLQGFESRPAQLEMAEAVAATLERGGNLVAEAGTGTGKTLAYLIPVLLSGKKVIVSTATKTLQDQLYRKDLPLVRHALGLPFQAVLLKGRANYLCIYRLQTTLGFKSGYSPTDAATLEAIRRWAKHTQTGDIAEAVDVPESSPLWAAATSTVDNCLGSECPQYAECHLVKARRAALEADVVVVNHHLLWADWTLRNDGFGELLPNVQAIVVDEAHQFLESSTQFLGLSVTSRQFTELADDITAEWVKDARDVPELQDEADWLHRQTEDLRLALGVETTRREAWHRVADDPLVKEIIGGLFVQLGRLVELLKPLAVRGKGLESCYKRCFEIGSRLYAFLDDNEDTDIGDTVRWFETRKRAFSLNRTPLTVANEFGKFRQHSQAAWVFASATLTVGGDFGHFINQCGLQEAECKAWDSPFDYQRQSLLYLPPGLPDPGTQGYTQAVVGAAVPVLRASRGRAFLLFTSHQALLEAAKLLPEHLDYPLFIQGSQPKSTLLEAFKRAGNGVLLGTASFWEGVDVQGPALSCVIIDKLPFASPGDPVLGARLESLKKTGVNPFMSYQLPTAILALKQGVGRLIRNQTDRGVLVLCDPRLVGRSYGDSFLDSLPDMPRSRALADVERFFAQI